MTITEDIDFGGIEDLGQQVYQVRVKMAVEAVTPQCDEHQEPQ